ncbi:MAG: ABC transporter permease [Flavisolibacter sp.]
MLKNYFRIAWRNIQQQKVFAGINILGLAIGIAACLLILQYVSYELGYEKMHEKRDRIYRVQQDRYDNGKLSTQWSAGAYAVGNSFKDAIPEIEEYVKILHEDNIVAEVNQQPIKYEKVYYASDAFFKIFSYPLLAGTDSALIQPYTAALSETVARTLFGTTNVVGKTMKLNRTMDYTITAVYKDPPLNTQLQPEILLSYATYVRLLGPDANPETAWLWDGCLTYLLLKKGASPEKVESRFPAIVDKQVGAQLKEFNASVVYKLQPLENIHLEAAGMGEPGVTGDGKTIYLLLGIAFFIAIIAWVNYINLATARALGRAKEVGVRKAIGSRRSQLIFQFLIESVLLNAIALILAILIVMVALPGFNRLSGHHLTFSLFKELDFWIRLLGLFFAGVFLAGLYPAFVLSNFKPIEVLKGRIVSTGKGALLRKSLVVVQFAASLFLLIATVTVYRQINFMRQQSLGLQIDQTLVIKPAVVGVDSVFSQQFSSFKNSLKQESAVKQVALSSTVPGGPVNWNAGGIKLVGTEVSEQKQYRVIQVDDEYINLYGLKMLAGRSFSRDFGNDEASVMFNRKGMEQLGIDKPEEAIGKKIDFWGEQYTIIGITDNFHQQSLKQAFEPLILRYNQGFRGYVSINTSTSQLAGTIDIVKKQWSQFFPGNTFDYYFLDDHYNAQYKADQQFGQVFGLFAGLAILVACMGLFGLASFTTVQKTKEIGIRKVLGANVANILNLLYQEFVWLLVIAFLVAVPIAWIVTNNWLRDFAFRIEIHWMFFVLPFVAIMLIAVLTVSFQAIKAALANPVKSLRTE